MAGDADVVSSHADIRDDSGDLDEILWTDAVRMKIDSFLDGHKSMNIASKCAASDLSPTANELDREGGPEVRPSRHWLQGGGKRPRGSIRQALGVGAYARARRSCEKLQSQERCGRKSWQILKAMSF